MTIVSLSHSDCCAIDETTHPRELDDERLGVFQLDVGDELEGRHGEWREMCDEVREPGEGPYIAGLGWPARRGSIVTRRRRSA